MWRRALFALLLTMPVVGQAQPFSEPDPIVCEELKERFRTTIDHMDDFVAWLTSGKTHLTSVGERMERRHREVDGIIQDVQYAIEKQHISRSCRNDLQRMTSAFNDRYEEAGREIQKQFNYFVR